MKGSGRGLFVDGESAPMTQRSRSDKKSFAAQAPSDASSVPVTLVKFCRWLLSRSNSKYGDLRGRIVRRRLCSKRMASTSARAQQQHRISSHFRGLTKSRPDARTRPVDTWRNWTLHDAMAAGQRSQSWPGRLRNMRPTGNVSIGTGRMSGLNTCA